MIIVFTRILKMMVGADTIIFLPHRPHDWDD